MTNERDAYTIAEEEAARAIARALDATLGRDFFIAHPDGAPLCATFQFDEVPSDLGAQFSTTRQFNTVAVNASLRLTSARRGDIAQQLSLLLSRYPYLSGDTEFLALLRIREDGFPAITTTTLFLEDGTQASAWQADVGFVAVFNLRH